MEDLCYYWCTYGHRVEVGPNPMIATLFLHKIVASHFMHYIAHFTSLVESLERSSSDQIDLARIDTAWIERCWCDVKDWSKTCLRRTSDLERHVAGLEMAQPHSNEMLECIHDFRDICGRLAQLKRDCDSCLSSLTGLAGIVSSRRSLLEAERSAAEARSLKTLSWLATIFVPPTLVSGIFSMNELYVPGVGQFWIYLAVVLPMIALVLLVILARDSTPGSMRSWAWTTWTRISTGRSRPHKDDQGQQCTLQYEKQGRLVPDLSASV